jgi:formylglycine-generating enzyme required for sulfatase activity
MRLELIIQRICLVFLFLVVASAGVLGAPRYSFREIVKSGDFIDGVTVGAMNQGNKDKPVDINDHGDIIFIASWQGSHKGFSKGVGLFKNTSLIVGSGDNIINGHETSPNSDVGVNNTGDIVFFQRTEVFSPSKLIAGPGALIQGVSVRNAFFPRINNQGVVAFRAGLVSETGSGIFTQDRIVAKPGDFINGHQISSVFSGPSLNEFGDFAFNANLENSVKAVLTDKRYIAQVGELVDEKAITDFVGTPIVTDRGQVFYIAEFIGGSGIFIERKLLVETGSVVDGKIITKFNSLDYSERGGLIFHADIDIGNGVFSIEKMIAGTGEIVDGKILKYVSMPAINSKGNIAFVGHYTENSYAAIIASPVLHNASESSTIDSCQIVVNAGGSPNTIGGKGTVLGFLQIQDPDNVKNFEFELVEFNATNGYGTPSNITLEFSNSKGRLSFNNGPGGQAQIGQTLIAFRPDPHEALLGLISESPYGLGDINATINWNSGGGETNASAMFKVRAYGQLPIGFPKVSVSKDSISFGPVEVGQPSSQVITVSNSGNASLIISSITSTSEIFSISENAFTLDTGETKSVTVTFTPSASGVVSGDLEILSNDPNSNQTLISITGVGVVTIEVTTPTDKQHQMVLVPEGEFSMGSELGDTDESPVHTVFLDSYYIDKYEVTNGLYQEFALATGRTQTSTTNDDRFNGTQKPVASVSWFDADAYCKWINGRLPTEAEWEKAARGTGGRKYPWGGEWDSRRANIWVSGDPYGNSATPESWATTPIGYYDGTNRDGYQTLDGGSPYGAHDMVGNVWEWCADWYDGSYYAKSSLRNPTGSLSGDWHVLRGNSWSDGDGSTGDVGASDRRAEDPSYAYYNVGFRCVAGIDIVDSTNKAPQVNVVDTLSFGDVQVGDSIQKVLTVSNTGNINLTISSITSNSDQFNLSGPSLNILPGDAQSINVDFTPDSLGIHNGTITITSNDPNNPLLMVSVSGTGVAAPPGPAPDISLSSSVLNFGNQWVGQGVGSNGSNITITNNGDVALVLTSVSSSDPQFTFGDPKTFSLSPGGAKALQVYFGPTSPGSHSATITINSNDPDQGAVSFTATGTGVAQPAADIVLSSTSLLFGDVQTGQSSTQKLRVSNTGNAGLSVFSIISSNGQYTITPVSFSLMASDVAGKEIHFQDVTVTFTPNDMGVQSATLIVSSDDSDEGSLAVSLSGNGVAQPVPDISLSSSSISFGEGQVGQSFTQSFTISNSGSAVLAVGKISSSSDRFVSSDAGNFTLNPNETRSINVTFNPNTTGQFSESVTIISDDPDENSLALTLTGTGVSPPPVLTPDISLSVASLNFGDVTMGQSQSHTFSISNVGNAVLAIGTITSSSTQIVLSEVGSFTLSGGELRTITVTFSPGTIGDFSENITINTNDPDESTLVITLVGTGLSSTPPDTQPPSGNSSTPILIALSQIDIGQVTTGSSAQFNVLVKNMGDAILAIDSLYVTGDGFSVEGVRLGIAPGDSALVHLGFRPGSLGTFQGSLYIKSNDTSKAFYEIALIATGVAPVRIPNIVVDKSRMNFGNVVGVGSRGQQDLDLRNTGETTLNFSITTSSSTVEVEPAQGTVDVGGTTTLTVFFAPTQAGIKNESVTIHSDDPDQPEFVVEVFGDVQAYEGPRISVSTDSIGFADTQVGLSTQSKLIIHNVGVVLLEVSDIQVEGLGFEVQPNRASVLPGDSISVVVQFNPDHGGEHQGILTILGNDKVAPTIGIPLIGQGTVILGPQALVEPNQLEFGVVTPGESKTLKLSIRNGGTEDLVILSLFLEDDVQFHVETQLTQPIPPGFEKSVLITFTPILESVQSPRLLIQTNDVTTPTYTVVLNGLRADLTNQIRAEIDSVMVNDVFVRNWESISIRNGLDRVRFVGSVAGTEVVQSPRWSFVTEDEGNLIERPLGSDRVINIEASTFGQGRHTVFYRVTFDDINETHSDSIRVIVRERFGHAIIVAGGDQELRNRYSNIAAINVYNTLVNKRRFETDDVVFLSDKEGWFKQINGIHVTSKIITVDRLHQEIDKAKPDNVEREVPLLIFLAGHGGLRNFQLREREILQSSDMKRWLDAINNEKISVRGLANATEIPADEIVLVVDFCYSRTFLSDISGPGRIVIGSSSEEVASVIDGISFAETFFKWISKGGDRANLWESFSEAREQVLTHFPQSPYIDVNGDGISIIDERGNITPGQDAEINIAQRVFVGGQIGGRATTLGIDPELYEASYTKRNDGDITLEAKGALGLTGLSLSWAAISGDEDIPASGDPNTGSFETVQSIDADTVLFRSAYTPETDGTQTVYVIGKDDLGNFVGIRHLQITKGVGSTTLDSDFNGDGKVGFEDFLLFAGGFGKKVGDEDWDVRMDLDGDEQIGFGDFLVLAGKFGK